MTGYFTHLSLELVDFTIECKNVDSNRCDLVTKATYLSYAGTTSSPRLNESISPQIQVVVYKTGITTRCALTHTITLSENCSMHHLYKHHSPFVRARPTKPPKLEKKNELNSNCAYWIRRKRFSIFIPDNFYSFRYLLKRHWYFNNNGCRRYPPQFPVYYYFLHLRFY